MNKTFVYIIVGLVLVLSGSYWLVGQGGSAAAPSEATATLNADVYPLYTGATWGEVASTTSPDYGQITVVQSVPFTDVTDIAEKSTPFEKYYEDKLIAAGWVRDDMRAASGPGANITYYTKGGQFVIVFFCSDFKVKHPDTPSECPCDVQFSLISGTQAGATPEGI